MSRPWWGGRRVRAGRRSPAPRSWTPDQAHTWVRRYAKIARERCTRRGTRLATLDQAGVDLVYCDQVRCAGCYPDQGAKSVEPHLQEVRAVLTTTPARWLSLTATLSAAVLEYAPAPGEWSAADCLGHLLQTEQDVFPQRVQSFLTGGDLASFAPAPEAHGAAGLSLAARAAAFARLRAQNLALIDGLTPADLARSALHGELGRVTLGEFLHTWVAHDLNHTMQAERAVVQPFIAGSGAWRTRFAELIVPKPA